MKKDVVSVLSMLAGAVEKIKGDKLDKAQKMSNISLEDVLYEV